MLKLLTLLMFLSLAPTMLAQNRVIKIGFTDPSCKDGPIKGVKVYVKGPKYSKRFKTDSSGRVEISGLREGTYTFVAEKYGFKRHILRSVLLHEDLTIVQDAYALERGYASNDSWPITPGYDPCKHEDLKPRKFVHVP